MKTLFFATAIMTMSLTATAQRVAWRCDTYTNRADLCHQGDVEVNTETELNELRSMRCVNGNVVITGPDFGTNGQQFRTLNFGQLREVTGIIVIHGIPFLTWIEAPFLQCTNIGVIMNNPWLPYCDAQDFCDEYFDVGACHRCGGSSSGCK